MSKGDWKKSTESIVPLRGVVRNGVLASILDQHDNELGAPVTATPTLTGGLELIGPDGEPLILTASSMPRQNILSELLNIIDGEGELAYATDTKSLVVLDGATPQVFSQLDAGVWSAVDRTLTAGTLLLGAAPVEGAPVEGLLVSSSGGSASFQTAKDFTVFAGPIDMDATTAGVISIVAGTNFSEVSGMGGAINLQPGTGITTNGTIRIKDGNGSEVIRVGTTAAAAPGLSFFGQTTVKAKPAITGSRGGNAALTSLLTELAALGLITNSTSA